MPELRPIPGCPSYSVTRDGRVWSHCFNNQQKIGGWLKPVVTNGYLRVRLDGKAVFVHRLVWLAFKGPVPGGFEIDHEDRNPANNDLSNLRLVTRSQNRFNAPARRDSMTGFKGVSQNKGHARRGWASWFGRVRPNGHEHRTKYYSTPKEAAAALRELRERVCGEFAYHE